MASPTVAARTETATTTAATTITINFTQTTGDRVVIFLAQATNTGLQTPGDAFTDLTASGFSFHILYKDLLGTEGGNVVITWAGATSDKGAALAYNITAGTFDPAQAPEFSTVATGTSVNPNPGTVTPTGGAKDYLWLAGFGQAGEEADDDTWCTAAPTSFTNLLQKTTGITGAAGINASAASAEFASNAASMDPATFTVAQSLAWRAFTVAVHPAAMGQLPKTSIYPPLLAQ